MNSAMWFYEQDGCEAGPVSYEVIQAMVAEGTLLASDWVRNADTEVRLTVAEIPHETVNAVDDLEELTDLSELSFSFGESGFASLDLSSENPIAPTAPVEELFFVDSAGTIYGPMPLVDLLDLAKNGKLLTDDRVRKGEKGEWLTPLAMARIVAGVEDSTTTASETDNVQPPAQDIRDGNADTAAKQPQFPGKRRKKQSKSRSAQADDYIPDDIFAEVFEPDATVGQISTTSDTESASAENGSFELATDVAMSPADPVPATQPSLSPPAATVPGNPLPNLLTDGESDRRMPVPESRAKRPAGRFEPPTGHGSTGRFQETITKWQENFPKNRKVLGIIGGGLMALLLFIGPTMGWFTLPGFAPDVDGFIQSTVAEYKQISGRPIPIAKWDALKSRVSTEGKEIVTYYAKYDNLSEEDNKRRWAVAKLIELLSCDPRDPEKVAAVFADYERLHGTVGQ